MMAKIGNVELQKFDADCPADFKKIIMQCFEANPANRPDALEILESVESVKFNVQRASTTRRFANNFNTVT